MAVNTALLDVVHHIFMFIVSFAFHAEPISKISLEYKICLNSTKTHLNVSLLQSAKVRWCQLDGIDIFEFNCLHFTNLFIRPCPTTFDMYIIMGKVHLYMRFPHFQ